MENEAKVCVRWYDVCNVKSGKSINVMYLKNQNGYYGGVRYTKGDNIAEIAKEIKRGIDKGLFKAEKKPLRRVDYIGTLTYSCDN